MLLLVLSGLVHKEVGEGEGAKGDRTERAVNPALEGSIAQCVCE